MLDCDWSRRVLFRSICARLPELHRAEALPLLLLLAQEPWVRPLGEWRSPGGSLRARRDDLARHLYLHWPVPRFLYGALDVPEIAVARAPEEDAWAARLFAWLGRGGSPLAAVRAGIVPAPLTRRMMTRFLATTAGTRPMAALRQAQVAVLGGTPPLAEALLRSRLAEPRGPDPQVGEPFWAEVIGWLCRNPELPVRRVPELIEYAEARRRQAVVAGQPWSLTGRTAASALRGMERWAALQPDGPSDLPLSGLLPWSAEDWTITELASASALQAEAEAMHHCVNFYGGLVRRRKVAIFSLRQRGERKLTIEVSLGAARVTQARGLCNRPSTPAEQSAVDSWAAMNHLGR
jgi:hypothetical protein